MYDLYRSDCYSDLYENYGWRLGVHRAPTGYEHRWIVVTREGTFGFWNRREARRVWKLVREGWPVEAALNDGCPY